MERCTKELSFTATLVPMTEYSRMVAPLSTLLWAPMTTGPTTLAPSAISASSPSQTPRLTWKPGGVMSTLPSRTSFWAVRYWAKLPTSHQ